MPDCSCWLLAAPHPVPPLTPGPLIQDRPNRGSVHTPDTEEWLAISWEKGRHMESSPLPFLKVECSYSSPAEGSPCLVPLLLVNQSGSNGPSKSAPLSPTDLPQNVTASAPGRYLHSLSSFAVWGWSPAEPGACPSL